MLKINKEEVIKYSVFVLVLIALGQYLRLFLLVDFNNYLPIHSDEYSYYLNALSFYETSSLRASFSLSGYGSSVLGASVHGFVYSFFYGGIAKMLTWHHAQMVILNQIFFAVAMLFVLFQKVLSPAQRILLIALNLLFPVFLLYTFTYMQTVLHLSFALIMSVLVYRMYQTPKSKNPIYFFLGFVFLVGLFRPSWFFWMMLILPLASTRKVLFQYILLCLGGIAFSFLFIKFFAEPVPNYFSYLISLLVKGEWIHAILSFGRHFLENTYYYLTYIESGYGYTYLTIKYLILTPILYFTWKAYLQKKPLHIALAGIGWVNLFLLLALYDAFLWREIRILSPLFYFYSFFLVLELKPYEQLIILVPSLMVFYKSDYLIKNIILERGNISYNTLVEMQKELDFLREIPTSKGFTRIIIDFDIRDNSLDVLCLPVSNYLHHPICYAAPYYYTNKPQKGEYILLRTTDNKLKKGFLKLKESPYYTLYKKE